MRLISRLPDQRAAALYGVTAKIANGLNWLIVAAAVWTHLSGTAQGFFFSFLSLVTLQMLFDLGLGMALVQFAAHEWAIVSGQDRSEAERSRAQERLASVAQLSVKWYAIAGAIFFATLQVVGYAIFHGTEGVDWLPPWLFLTLMVSLDLASLGIWSVLEGCGRVRSVYFYRALKAVILGGVVWGTLLLDAGLYSLGWGYLAILPLTLGMLGGPNLVLLRRLLGAAGANRVRWSEEVAPLQWRLALSSISSYFAQWGVTPITFRLFSPAIAGQFGMVWSIINAVSAVANVVVTVQAARFGSLIASQRFAELDRLARKLGIVSVLLAWFGYGVAFLGLWVLKWLGSPLVDRVLPLESTLIMFAASALMAILNPLGVYLRSHKKEPYLGLSLAFGVGVLVATVVGASFKDTRAVALLYFALVAGLLLPFGIRIFLRCRREWHAVAAPPPGVT